MRQNTINSEHALGNIREFKQEQTTIWRQFSQITEPNIFELNIFAQNFISFRFSQFHSHAQYVEAVCLAYHTSCKNTGLYERVKILF